MNRRQRDGWPRAHGVCPRPSCWQSEGQPSSGSVSEEIWWRRLGTAQGCPDFRMDSPALPIDSCRWSGPHGGDHAGLFVQATGRAFPEWSGASQSCLCSKCGRLRDVPRGLVPPSLGAPALCLQGTPFPSRTHHTHHPTSLDVFPAGLRVPRDRGHICVHAPRQG